MSYKVAWDNIEILKNITKHFQSDILLRCALQNPAEMRRYSPQVSE